MSEDATKLNRSDEILINGYGMRMKALLEEAFNNEEVTERGRGHLLCMTTLNLLRMVKVNTSESDFNLMLSEMLRTIGLQGWKQEEIETH